MPRPAGYSGTPLARKLGIGENATVFAVDAPEQYPDLLHPLPAGARISHRRPRPLAFVHLFATRRDALAARLPKLRDALEQDGVIWVSWPKRSAGVATELSEDVIRELALPLGLVDVKVCAVDETWSGLKLVIRKELRR